MHLSNLTKNIKILKTYNFNKDKYFSSITSNSKLTNKNTIFFYDNNSNAKQKYIKEAVENKIPAIISNKYHKFLSIPQFVVSDINLEKEKLLKKIYKKLPYKSIAITGTNGKTSVVWYISKILTLLNYKNVTVGTLGYFKNGKKINEIGLTTPAYEELYKYGHLNTKGKSIYIFEASSHALDQNRIRNYPISIAAITNISNDHLDYHKTISQYKNTKIKLFTKYLSKNGTAVINSRIKNALKIGSNLKKRKIKVLYYGKNYTFIEKHKNFFKILINKKVSKIKNLKLSTSIEFENLECAITSCLALNIKEKEILKTLPTIINPPGRLQTLNYKKKKSQIIIDYAHTPDALEKILKSLKSKNKKPVLLFGCGGERDKNKRKLMGVIAKKFASRIYITDDNPRNENASKIRKSILQYCPDGIEVSNRKLAITKAIKDIKENETLLIAGKGHEKVQIIKNKKIKFDDYEIVKNIIGK
ncbi:MAG: hypothetical protein CBD97_03670 [Pelagibacteraceae bacterium TMED237]|nr:MAG: hypothetical protein CBD97_03670 [Pelagibacteraceae bacterium TMED237]|tara:strand:- start:2506 stop:3927 length:1422 start_codon:yes stop_codon:yes gene_type:complete